MEIGAPPKKEWNFTLSNTDKEPFGTFILYSEMKKIFPSGSVESYREPAYNLLHNKQLVNTAYICISGSFPVTKYDLNEIIRYVKRGNYFFVSANHFSRLFQDTMGFKKSTVLFSGAKDSQSVNFVNPNIYTHKNYISSTNLIPFYRNQGFRELKNLDTIVALGKNSESSVNFIKLPMGKGAIFIHADPLCFSNYFVLKNNNVEYTAGALSYIPATVTSIMWDEYYKLGRSGAATPLRFLLSNTSLRWAFWMALTGIVLFMFFESKRKQRIIPVIEPLKNSSLDFIKTVAGVYFQQKDNRAIAQKKIQYWLDYIRTRLFISTNETGAFFIKTVSQKSTVPENNIAAILQYSNKLNDHYSFSDTDLVNLNELIDAFYKAVK